MKSSVAKRSVIIAGHKTRVSLEDPIWKDLKEIAYLQRATLSQVDEEIDRARRHNNLSSAIRLFVSAPCPQSKIAHKVNIPLRGNPAVRRESQRNAPTATYSPTTETKYASGILTWVPMR